MQEFQEFEISSHPNFCLQPSASHRSGPNFAWSKSDAEEVNLGSETGNEIQI